MQTTHGDAACDYVVRVIGQAILLVVRKGQGLGSRGPYCARDGRIRETAKSKRATPAPARLAASRSIISVTVALWVRPGCA